MNPFSLYATTTTDVLENLWVRFVNYLPALMGAIVVFVIGWIIATLLGKLVTKVLSLLRLNEAIDRLGLGKVKQESGVTFDVPTFGGGLIQWFLVLVFLLAATDILGLRQVTAFLNQILLYIPNVIVAVIILIIGVLVGNFLAKVVRNSVRLAKITSAEFVAMITRWSVVIFALLAALVQLGVAQRLIEIFFTGVVAMIAIAGGLAFGLGGKEEAQSVLKKVRDEIGKKAN